jgi:hypothetical protein
VELGVIIVTPGSVLLAPCYIWQAEQLYTAPCDVQTQRVNFFNKRPRAALKRWYTSLGFRNAPRRNGCKNAPRRHKP